MRLFQKQQPAGPLYVHLFAAADVVGGHLEACGERAHCVAVLTLSLNKCAICKRGDMLLSVHTSLRLSLSLSLSEWEWRRFESRFPVPSKTTVG